MVFKVVTRRPAAQTLQAATHASVSMDMLVMGKPARTSMSVKRTMGAATLLQSAPIWMVGEGVSVVQVSQVTASSAQTSMNAQGNESAIGMPPAPITPVLMCAIVMRAIKEMESTCAWT